MVAAVNVDVFAGEIRGRSGSDADFDGLLVHLTIN